MSIILILFSIFLDKAFLADVATFTSLRWLHSFEIIVSKYHLFKEIWSNMPNFYVFLSHFTFYLMLQPFNNVLSTELIQ